MGRQVTSDGETRALPNPFFVIATQNPSSQDGTFPLPESQLDRFLMRISLGYPDAEVERAMLAGEDPRAKMDGLTCKIKPEQMQQFMVESQKVQAAPAILDYIQRSH